MNSPGLREKLRGEVQSVAWAALEPFLEKGTLLRVAGDLDLVEVGACMAEDRRAEIEGWLLEGRMGRPDVEILARWRSEPQTTFAFLIIQPYVLAQEMVQ
jgi:hypothetical protein